MKLKQNKKRTIVWLIAFGAVITLFAFPMSVYANTSDISATEESYEDRGDEIITKYSFIDGVLCYRRWNETQHYWIDPYWIPC